MIRASADVAVKGSLLSKEGKEMGDKIVKWFKSSELRSMSPMNPTQLYLIINRRPLSPRPSTLLFLFFVAAPQTYMGKIGTTH